MRHLFLFFWLSICAVASAQETATLGWDPSTNATGGYYLYYGNVSQTYTVKLDVGTNITFTVTNLQLGSNYYFAVSSYDTNGVESTLSSPVSLSLPLSLFLTGSVSLGDDVDYLSFTNGNYFGYYAVVGFPWIYHFDMGYEYIFEGWDGHDGVYFYDASSGSFWYTSPSLFPYLYDFSLNSWIYYYPDTTRQGHYTTNPRYFYVFAQKKIITK